MTAQSRRSPKKGNIEAAGRALTRLPDSFEIGPLPVGPGPVPVACRPVACGPVGPSAGREPVRPEPCEFVWPAYRPVLLH